MKQVMVRYKVKPERVRENEELVRAVYAALHRTGPAGLRYATFKLDDGVSFVHVAASEEDVLPGLASFQEFQRNIGERTDEAPVVTRIEEIGSYGSGR